MGIYSQIIDVFLDTFPFVGGLACRDIMSHGKPVVSLLSGEWDVLLRSERLDYLLAESCEDYVSIVKRLLNDADFYYKASEDTRLLMNMNSSGNKMIADVEFAIEKVAELS